MADTSLPRSTPAAAQRRTAWVLFAPLAAVAGLRWVLQWLADRAMGAPALPLAPFAGTQDPAGRLASMGGWAALLAVACALVWLAWRRWGGRPVRRVLAVGWVALCVAACGALLWRHLNVQGVQAQPPVVAEVLGSRFQKPTAHGPGGTLVVLRVPGIEPAQQVLVDDPAAARWQPGQRLRLQWATGRYGGRFVTGWQALG